MTKTEYLSRLLALCTDKQKNLFCRMYPKGPNEGQLSRAISQAENTLKNLNVMKSDLRNNKIAAKNAQEEVEKELSDLQGILRYTEEALEDTNESIKKLSNPINTENKDIQERLELLDALEAGGVDNWEFYDASIDDYRRNNSLTIDT